MIYLPFKEKSKYFINSILNRNYLTVAEGAVRSAKTFAANTAFLLNIIDSKEYRHLITGVSQASIMANCIDGEFGMIAISHGTASIKRDKKNETYLAVGTHRIDMFGGNTVSSFRAFRGRTYGSVYNDEANLQHENTINESFNRTIASKERVHIMTLNPDVPDHWLYQDYLDRYKELSEKGKLVGYNWFHFTLDDNPAISEERKREIEIQYTGLFYQRFILGLRVRAEGAIFVSFSDDSVIKDAERKAEIIKKIQFVEIGGDIGGNQSATVYNAVGYWVEPKLGLCAACLEEKYDKANLSTESIIANYKNFRQKVIDTYKQFIKASYIDNESVLIIKSLRKVDNNVTGSLKIKIIDRIRLQDALFSQKRLFVFDNCPKLISAYRSALWDSKNPTKEERLDDGTTNIDSLDATEYSLERHRNDFLRY